ncbi:MAG: TIGR02450 family Trp-rich protein [Motiliproteus sp.]|nr:TIGR02450 family Trp-rich protein [Motiliproteus sp.]MCW9053784.1 TIGR02450 family Trp-rich protein [Motiliproteus sp.]
MYRINPNKLLHSKWTHRQPVAKRKHFIVVELNRDEDGVVTGIILEAVIDNYQQLLPWRALKDQQNWLQGWK